MRAAVSLIPRLTVCFLFEAMPSLPLVGDRITKGWKGVNGDGCKNHTFYSQVDSPCPADAHSGLFAAEGPPERAWIAAPLSAF
jgi:hypothetical protein